MERALFVAHDDDALTRELLREAAELAAGVGSELLVLWVMAEDEYEERLESRRELLANEPDRKKESAYPVTSAEEDAKRRANRLAEDTLDDLALEWSPLGAVGREEQTVLEVAEGEGADHLFIVGKRRSPSGKAIFGDLAQRLIIQFDGPVTTQIPGLGND
ncbi:MAG: universal stress protein [Halanaeroarchaeum sp.]